jgi:hypothetical protein
VSEIRILNLLPFPEEKVNLKIPVANLLNLPPGASFGDRNGRAGVVVGMNNDTIPSSILLLPKSTRMTSTR